MKGALESLTQLFMIHEVVTGGRDSGMDYLDYFACLIFCFFGF